MRSLVVMACAAALGGCSYTVASQKVYGLPEAQLSRVLESRAGALVIDHRYLKYCEVIAVRLLNTGTGRTVTVTNHMMANTYAGPAPQILIVEPGRYLFQAAGCQSARYVVSNGYDAYYTTSHRSFGKAALWLEPVTVSAGRVTYPGSVFEEVVSHEYGVALLLRETLSGRKTRSIERYPLYSVVDKREEVTGFLKLFNPALVERLDVAIQPTRLDKEQVNKVIDQAFAEEAGDIPPDDATARRNRDAALKRIDDFVWSEALRQLQAEFGDALPTMFGKDEA